MKVFVSGGTGFIGKHLVPQLVKNGYDVVALVRDPSKAAMFKKLSISIVIGDLTRPKSFDNQLRTCDVFIHLAALRANWGKTKDFYAVNTGVFNSLLRKKTTLKHIIVTSSVYVFGDLKKIPADETHPLQARDLYGKSKVVLEQQVMKLPIPYTIIRPAIVYGPGDNKISFMNKLIAMIKRKKMFLAGSGKNLIHLIYIDDLVKGYLNVIKKGGENQVYIFAGPTPIALEKLIAMISKKLHVQVSYIRLPYFFVLLASYISAGIYRCIFVLFPQLIHNEPFLLPIKVKTIGKSWYYTTSKAKKNLQFYPRVPYNQGIKNVFSK